MKKQEGCNIQEMFLKLFLNVLNVSPPHCGELSQMGVRDIATAPEWGLALTPMWAVVFSLPSRQVTRSRKAFAHLRLPF